MGRKLGNFERQLLAYVQLRNLREIRTGDLTGPLNISSKQERELLSRMAKSGMIAQVRRGLYLVPSRLPLGCRWCVSDLWSKYVQSLWLHGSDTDSHLRV
jgi:predicted transcriptional regulator of viral defense system